MSKIIAVRGQVTFVQTHAERGSVWAHVGKLSFPCALSHHSDLPTPYVEGWDESQNRATAIPLLSSDEWDAAPDYS